MKIYAVYARIKLIEKPDWLESFRSKYGTNYDYHVTFKQPSYIDKSDLAEIKRILTQTFKYFSYDNHAFELIFDKLEANREDGSIMIMARYNPELANLQEQIVVDLAAYSNFVKPKFKKYEENFRPHLTLATDLGGRFDEAMKDLDQNVRCVGEITKIVLSCVNEISPKEAKDPANQTIFKL